ncbi:MAG: hypothetical protein U0797_26450 [Gemmataceae bacterium]
MSSQPYERVAVVGTIDPQNGNNSTLSTDYVDMSKFAEALFVFQLGAVDNTVDCLVRESTTTSDGGGQTLSGKSATQLTSSDDNKQVVINVKAEELSIGYRYLRGRMAVGNGTTNMVSCVALGLVPRFGPASDDDLADVAQVVT